MSNFNIHHIQCFKQLVIGHINSSLPLQPWSTAICLPLQKVHGRHHLLLSSPKIWITRTYIRFLFIDWSSAFYTITPYKLLDLEVNIPLCHWMADFLTLKPQSVRIGDKTLSIIPLNARAPPGCVHGPLLYSLYTHGSVAKFYVNSIYKLGMLWYFI